MSEVNFNSFTSGTMWLALIMVPISLARWKRVGFQSLYLSSAFLAVALLMFALGCNWATLVLIALGLLVFCLLVMDAVTRLKQQT